jgi:hypothetical protein
MIELVTTNTFKNWAYESMRHLNLRPSDLLRDQTPGSKNKVNVLLKRNHKISLDDAYQLVIELNYHAQKKGLSLKHPTLRHKS